MLLYINTQRPIQDITPITFITLLLVPPLGVEPREFFLLRETTLPICPRGPHGVEGGTRTHKTQILSLICIPIPSQPHIGAPTETRTRMPKQWLLRPPCLPIPPSGHN